MPDVRDLAFDDLRVGQSAELHWSVSAEDIDAFAALSGDVNPLHVDAAFAADRGFPDRVAHGMLLGSKVSAFVGTLLPGRRCLLLEQSLAFPNPVFAGDRVTVSGEVAELWPDQMLLRIKMRATKSAAGKTVTVGRGSVLCKTLS